MCEILFKGKMKDNSEWVEGYYWKDIWGDNTEYIYFDGEDYEVIPETVRQFTGKELGNKKLYVGDIVEWCADYDDDFGYPVGIYELAVVVYDEINCCYAMKIGNELLPFSDWEWSNCTVIGNIHDNPELMKEV